MFNSRVFWSTCAAFCSLLISVHIHAADATTQPLTPRLLHQFPNGSWVENINTLSSGLLLVTMLHSPDLVLLDPQNSTKGPTVVYHDASHTAFLGIAQPSDRTLAVVYGNLNIPGTFGVHLFALNSNGTVSLNASFPIPGAQALDGLTALPNSPRFLLSADKTLGVIWRLDLSTGAAEIAFTSSLLQPAPNTTLAAVNGVHVQSGFVYFTNSNTATFGRIGITSNGLPVNGSSTVGEIIVRDFANDTYDDFALGQQGSDTFFLCSPPGFAINKVTLQGDSQVVWAGGMGDSDFAYPVAAMLGKTKQDQGTLYVTTAGTISGLGGTRGGQVFAVDMEE